MTGTAVKECYMKKRRQNLGMFWKTQAALGDVLEKANIKNSMNLFYTAQELFDEKYSFRNPHIARVGRFQTLTGTDIAADLIGSKEVLSMKAFNAMANRLKWAPVSASGIFVEIEKGIGMNPDTKREGIHVNNFYATYSLGPYMILNPHFAKELLGIMGLDTDLCFEKEIIDAYNYRLSELTRTI